MYAVIKSGGKQYRVEEGQQLKLEKLAAEVGQVVDLGEVLLVADGEEVLVGENLPKKANVKAEVLAHERDKKVEIIKFRRRKHSMTRMGHRQSLTKVQITKIDK